MICDVTVCNCSDTSGFFLEYSKNVFSLNNIYKARSKTLNMIYFLI